MSFNGSQPDGYHDASPKDVQYIHGGKRCAVQFFPLLKNWWVGTSPRNGMNASVEGTWEDWVTLARGILEAEERRLKGAEVAVENDELPTTTVLDDGPAVEGCVESVRADSPGNARTAATPGLINAETGDLQ